MSGVSIFDPTPPRWFSIEADRPFLADLAAGLVRALAPLGPEGAERALILLPNRRAVRELTHAFVAAFQGRAAILPRIRALGDLEEGETPWEIGEDAFALPPALAPGRRRFELARLVAENADVVGRSLDAQNALDLADALAAFLDSCQLEERGEPAALANLVDGDLARHWRISARFLGLALEAWPRRLAELGVMDIMERRVTVMRRMMERWHSSPPEHPIIAAGSTGAAPAAADLLAAIGHLPAGLVVLAGLDSHLEDAAWETVTEQHPQNGFRRLLEVAGVARGEVRAWPGARSDPSGLWRRRLVNEALRPAAHTADWLGVIERIRAGAGRGGGDPIVHGLAGLSVIAARNEDEEGSVVAVLLREALDTEGKTAALITPDAGIARRVAARLTRWGIVVDSSAGAALALQPPALLASLVARLTADPSDPVTLLAILKHPATRFGALRDRFSAGLSPLERYGLRGPRPRDWEALRRRLETRRIEAAEGDRPSPGRLSAVTAAVDLLPPLRVAFDLAGAPFAAGAAPAAEAARGLVRCMEALAGGPASLWSGEAGAATSAFLASLIGDSGGLPEVTRAGFAELLDGLLARETVHAAPPAHPRLRILGVLEGRLIHADRLVLAGLSEGVWPQAAANDPFLSRPMRATLGLPPPERRIGLSAHDFAQAAAAPEVILTHSERRAGAPAVASRWLWRLRTLAKGAGVAIPDRADALAWARTLDAPISPTPPVLARARRPAPTPPVAARPRRVSVTAVERWQRDPYSLYARDILRLRPLEPPDQQIDAMIRGSAFHSAFERFAVEHPGELAADAEGVFMRFLIEALDGAGMAEARMARERALAAPVSRWFVDFERARRPGAEIFVERRGLLSFPSRGGDFTLTARADRLERRADATDILDFKTGAAPTSKLVESGLSPQLTLTAAILAAGGFEEVGPTSPGELVYVRVGRARVPGEVIVRAEGAESARLARAALAGLKRLVARFDDPATPYRSWVMPQFISRFGGDYDRLARLWEWRVLNDEEGVD